LILGGLADARSVPKALLHDHLDGGLRVVTVIELADEIGWLLPHSDPDALQAWFTAGAAAKDLLQYLATFEHTLAVMQTETQIERVAYECAIDLASDGVVYAEVRFAPELHQQQRLSLEAVTTAVTSGFRRAERDAAASGNLITVNAILCAMRTEQRSMEIVQLVDRMRETDHKVVAFDLAGAETGWPPSLHSDALAFARERHLNVTIHASEPPDLELIDDAIVHGAHRIGHGVRLQRDVTRHDDGSLVLGPLARYVLDHQIHLEMAPTCHVQVGAVESFEQHPIAMFLRNGLNVGINTDNRLMSDVMPSTELLAVATTFDLTWIEIEQLVTNALMSAFAPLETRKEIVAKQVRPWFATQGATSV
jgi:adenosine deaminase